MWPLRKSLNGAEVILCFTSFYISVKCSKFKLAREITKSGDKKVGPSHVVLIQAKLPASPRCLGSSQELAVDFRGTAPTPRLQEEGGGAEPTGVFTAEVWTEQDL